MAKPRSNGSLRKVQLKGEIRAADLDRRTFSLRLPDGRTVKAKFSRAQESTIIEALHDHASCWILLTGRGEFLPNGKLTRVVSVAAVEMRSARQKPAKKDNRPIWEVLEELGRSIPAEEWAKVPKDGAKNLDHYLYGHAKRD